MKSKHLIRSGMRMLGRLVPRNERGESPCVVRCLSGAIALKNALTYPHPNNIRLRRAAGQIWPVTPGQYEMGDQDGHIAVCTLMSKELLTPLSKEKGVAIVGTLVTVNLGIEALIRNTISNRRLRYLVVCGKDSLVFHTCQALTCLFENGLDANKRINGARGHYPVLTNLSVKEVDQFRRQLQLVDVSGVLDLNYLSERLTRLRAGDNPQGDHDRSTRKRQTAVFNNVSRSVAHRSASFRTITPGGPPSSSIYDSGGFFVVTLEDNHAAIVVRHYYNDGTPGHEIRGRRANSILRAICSAGLVQQISHAGYLGLELSKAETAIRFRMEYEQDRPLRHQSRDAQATKRDRDV